MKTNKYGLIGNKISHSFSKDIHNMFGNNQYEYYSLDESNFDDFISNKCYDGLNITIPYKQRIIKYLDYVDPEAKEIGSVNTVINNDGKLFGYNTDLYGFNELLKKNNINLKNKSVLILGTGGTSNTVEYCAKKSGAKLIQKVGRIKKDKCVTYEEANSKYTNFEIMINTTPCGTNGFEDDLPPIKLDNFINLEFVIDVIYNPLNSKLIIEAKKRNIKTCSGLYMLIKQAQKSSELFGFDSFDDIKINNIYKEIIKLKYNIILIGMPSCGKTTIGKILSDKYGMSFIDTDAEIEKTEKKPVADIINNNGIEYFRNIETKKIIELNNKKGYVISTGGGSILDFNNVQNLLKLGIVIYLDRPIELLKPSEDRPLSSKSCDLHNLYLQRKDLYTSFSNHIIKSNGTIEKTIDDIEGVFK